MTFITKASNTPIQIKKLQIQRFDITVAGESNKHYICNEFCFPKKIPREWVSFAWSAVSSRAHISDDTAPRCSDEEKAP
jgi:hypothetical protein